jgi:hypothetical protein
VVSAKRDRTTCYFDKALGELARLSEHKPELVKLLQSQRVVI